MMMTMNMIDKVIAAVLNLFLTITQHINIQGRIQGEGEPATSPPL